VCPQAGPAAGHGQDGSGATRADAADPLDTPEARAERQNDDLADEDDADSVLCGSEGSGASSEHSVVQPAPAPGAAGRGKGRGRGKGTAGAPAPAPAAAGRGKGRGKGGGANGAAQKKYKWVDIADHTFTPRAPFDGPDKPTLGPEYDHLSIDSPPHEWFKMRDAPEQEYHDRAANSEAYRSLRHARGDDGKTAAGRNKKCYDGAAEISYADISTVVCVLQYTYENVR
jgi:hypothetical protein